MALSLLFLISLTSFTIKCKKIKITKELLTAVDNRVVIIKKAYNG